MPSSAAQSARREALAARRQAVEALRLAEAIAGYAAGQVADGLSPSGATRAALDAADAMEATAMKLRALTRIRLGPARPSVARLPSNWSRRASPSARPPRGSACHPGGCGITWRAAEFWVCINTNLRG